MTPMTLHIVKTASSTKCYSLPTIKQETLLGFEGVWRPQLLNAPATDESFCTWTTDEDSHYESFSNRMVTQIIELWLMEQGIDKVPMAMVMGDEYVVGRLAVKLDDPRVWEVLAVHLLDSEENDGVTPLWLSQFGEFTDRSEPAGQTPDVYLSDRMAGMRTHYGSFEIRLVDNNETDRGRFIGLAKQFLGEDGLAPVGGIRWHGCGSAFAYNITMTRKALSK